MEKYECSICGKWHPRTNMTKNKRKPDGLGYWCNPCNDAYQKNYSLYGKIAEWPKAIEQAWRMK
jgi:hypothetical protein